MVIFNIDCSHNIYEVGLLFYRPWVCCRLCWIWVFPTPPVPPGPRLLLLLMLFPSPVHFLFKLRIANFPHSPKPHFRYTTILAPPFSLTFSPQHLWSGSPFLPSLSVLSSLLDLGFPDPPVPPGPRCCCWYCSYYRGRSRASPKGVRGALDGAPRRSTRARAALQHYTAAILQQKY